MPSEIDGQREAIRQEAFAEVISIIEELDALWEARGVFATSSMIVRAIRDRAATPTVPAALSSCSTRAPR